MKRKGENQVFCIVTSIEEKGWRVKKLETGLFMVDFCRDRASPFLGTKEGSCSRRRHRPETFPSAALMHPEGPSASTGTQPADRTKKHSRKHAVCFKNAIHLLHSIFINAMHYYVSQNLNFHQTHRRCLTTCPSFSTVCNQ